MKAITVKRLKIISQTRVEKKIFMWSNPFGINLFLTNFFNIYLYHLSHDTLLNCEYATRYHLFVCEKVAMGHSFWISRHPSFCSTLSVSILIWGSMTACVLRCVQLHFLLRRVVPRILCRPVAFNMRTIRQIIKHDFII